MNQSETPQSLTMLSLSQIDDVANRLPAGITATLFSFPQLFIAGGFIRAVLAGETPKDIDIFTTDLSIVERAVEHYVRQCERYGLAMKESLTPCTITVRGEEFPVQFVNNVAYESPESCLQKFDFTVCQAAFWIDNGNFSSVCASDFIRDVAKKRLVYTSPNRVEAPGGSLWRAARYMQRGYSITQEELAKLVQRLMRGVVREDPPVPPCEDGWLEEAHEMARNHYHTPGVDIIRRSFNMGGAFGTY